MIHSDEPISIREALEHPLILPSPISYTYGEILQDLAREHGIDMRVEMFIDGLGPRKQAVIAGLGATLLTKVAVEQEVRDGLLIARPIDPPLLRPVVLREREGIDPDARDWLRSVIGIILDELMPGDTALPGDAATTATADALRRP